MPRIRGGPRGRGVLKLSTWRAKFAVAVREENVELFLRRLEKVEEAPPQDQLAIMQVILPRALAMRGLECLRALRQTCERSGNAFVDLCHLSCPRDFSIWARQTDTCTHKIAPTTSQGALQLLIETITHTPRVAEIESYCTGVFEKICYLIDEGATFFNFGFGTDHRDRSTLVLGRLVSVADNDENAELAKRFAYQVLEKLFSIPQDVAYLRQAKRVSLLPRSPSVAMLLYDRIPRWACVDDQPNCATPLHFVLVHNWLDVADIMMQRGAPYRSPISFDNSTYFSVDALRLLLRPHFPRTHEALVHSMVPPNKRSKIGRASRNYCIALTLELIRHTGTDTMLTQLSNEMVFEMLMTIPFVYIDKMSPAAISLAQCHKLLPPRAGVATHPCT